MYGTNFPFIELCWTYVYSIPWFVSTVQERPPPQYLTAMHVVVKST